MVFLLINNQLIHFWYKKIARKKYLYFCKMQSKAKYRILNEEELKELEEEFVHFLIVQGIDNDKWVKINEQEKEKAIQLVEIFSNTVLEKAYSKISFLEYRSKTFYSIFKILKNETLVFKVSQKQKGTYDFLKDNELSIAIQEKRNIIIEKGVKKHKEEKLKEVHKLCTQGCVISNEKRWGIFNHFH